MRVVLKDAEGKIHLKDEAGHPVAWGAVTGGVIGGLLFFFAPVVGIAAGSAAGAFLARSLDLDVDKQFIDDVAATLKPNTSALFLLVGEGNRAAILNAFKPYKGTVLQTSLTNEMGQQIMDALRERE